MGFSWLTGFSFFHCVASPFHSFVTTDAWSVHGLAGKKGMVECQRRGDIVAVLPRLELAAVNVVVAHASAKSYPAEAAKTAGWTAARAERTKRTWFRKDVPDHAAFRFVPFAVETSGYMGREAVKFVNRLGDIAAENGNIPKGSYKRVKGRSHTVEKRKASQPRVRLCVGQCSCCR